LGASRTAGSELPVLSRRQYEVLMLMATGMTDREIAVQLAISARTVRMHSDALRNKLGVSRRRHIIPVYLRLRAEHGFGDTFAASPVVGGTA
jgi:DNA-binding CsgD family transcriptional regulator